MASWKNTAITKKGAALLAKLQTGGELTLTKAMTGSGVVDVAALENMTAVADVKQTMQLVDVAYESAGAVVKLALNNIGLAAGYKLSQIGIYADDPDDGEILYFIAQATSPDVVPSETDSPGYAFEPEVCLAFGNADEVNITIGPYDYVTHGQLEVAIAEKQDICYCTCDTAADTAEKVVTIVEGDTESFAYTVGRAIDVKFTNLNNAVSPTLNVNGLGAKPIIAYYVSSSYYPPEPRIWRSGAMVRFVYDGTGWIIPGGTRATTGVYGLTKLNNTISSTSTAEAATANVAKMIWDEVALVEEDISDMAGKVSKKSNEWIATTSGTGSAYTVTLDPAPTSLYVGMMITIIPHVTSGSTSATLTVNGLGPYQFRQRGQTTGSLYAPRMPSFLTANKPVPLIYDGAYWIMLDYSKPYWEDIQGKPSYFRPNNHATPGTVYGAGDESNYGHVKLANNLTTDDTVTGTALDARQGRVLNEKIDTHAESESVHVTASERTAWNNKMDADDAVGKSLAGQTVDPTSTSSVTAGVGAEIFNDYRNRAFGGNGDVLQGNVACDEYSHAEGCKTTAASYCSHAEGFRTLVKDAFYGHAEGMGTKVQGMCGHAEGWETIASGHYSNAGGYKTAAGDYQHVSGRLNKYSSGPTSFDDMSGDIFIVGNGTEAGTTVTRANALRTTTAGKTYGLSAFSSSGADYAEYFEWLDKNPDNMDRRGLFVTLEGSKIRLADKDDSYILGVISSNPVIEGDSQSEIWKDMYLTDVFGEKIKNVVEVEETIDEETGSIIPAHTEVRWVLNPDYNPEKEYIRREDRPEWSPVGMLGKLVVVDDGTCEVNGYCKPGLDGVGTKGDTGYRVLERMDATHVRVLVR